MGETPAGTARAEDPFGKVVFFTELAEAVPAEREPISLEERSIDYLVLNFI